MAYKPIGMIVRVLSRMGGRIAYRCGVMVYHDRKDRFEQGGIAMPVRDPEHDFVLKLCDTVLHIQWQTIQEFFQDGYGFLLKRQVAVILQGLAGR